VRAVKQQLPRCLMDGLAVVSTVTPRCVTDLGSGPRFGGFPSVSDIFTGWNNILHPSGETVIQGSYGHGKPGKVMAF